ncbi:flagellar basal-body MS-ring/collar protein FliF [uncultured Azohydromonas sp.]|jgi:flagellar basal-body M-ring protein/flagellar hook-basal body protein (fliF)|uniref:flagellar basal-body MS-ring/collar protein FliF n=1 Tax=uncultured Azohydromonas sp. TaxID=487342 RepID=UPI0026090C31|nr:flagellar basal-body MS-ring/collar protein FliF [uncultured Azohydromonas sp.]
MDQAIVPVNPQQPAADTATATPVPKRFARLAALPPRNKLMLGIGAAGLLAVLVALLLLWGREPDYRVLFTGLSDKDGGAVVAQLAQMNVPYRHGEGGTLLVPADKVHDARLKLASAGLPKGSVAGFELMDTARFGQTQFQERTNFQRGLEGELTRSIMSLGAVETARVHLALPQQTGFFREQQKPSASVLLTLRPGHSLDRTQIAGIVHLVASSVPEMNPKAVSVLDQSGVLLSGPEGVGAQGGLDAQQLAYVRQVERGLQQRLVDILEPLVGPQNLRASVTAELDFSQTESTAEQYRPNQGGEPAAVRSLHSSEVTGNGGTPPPMGVPGALSNQPPVAPNAPINGASAPLQPTQPNSGSGAGPGAKRENVVNYEVDKTVRVTRNATGLVKRLTAAVVINHRSIVDAKGRSTPVAATQEELDQITALVQESIGFNKERGDSVRVVSAPFHVDAVDPADSLPLWQQPWLQELLRSAGMPAALTLVALMLLLGLVRPALRQPAPPPGPALPPPGSRLDAVVDDPQLLPLPADNTTLADKAAPMLLSDENNTATVEQMRALARSNPAVVANILRGWFNKEG